MEKIKQQFGTVLVDEKERQYCQIYVVVDNNDAVNRMSLVEQFKLIAESFWLYIKEQEFEKEEKGLLQSDGDIEFDDSILRKGWF